MSLEDFKYNLRSLKKCNQYWDEMEPVDGGRMCARCNKKIVDFSRMSYTEIAHVMAESNKPVCGFYLPEQLHQKKPGRGIPLALGIGSIIASTNLALAQPTTVIQTTYHPVTNNSIEYNLPELEVAGERASTIIIRGTVTYIDTPGKQAYPVPFASIIIKETRAGTTCNENGEFSISYGTTIERKKIHLTISGVGFQTTELVVNFTGEQEYNVGAIALNKYEGDDTAFYVTVRRPWHKRIWSSLKRPFQKKA